MRDAQGDATYLIVKNDNTLQDYGLNAVCTHLGCVVPWNKARGRCSSRARSKCCLKQCHLAFRLQAENKFKCPCHGSQYNDEGKVIRGPAPLVRLLLFCSHILATQLTWSPSRWLWHTSPSRRMML